MVGGLAMIFDILFLVIVVFAIAIGFHRGLFDQLLAWVQIFFLFVLPSLLGAPLMKTGLGKSLAANFKGLRLPEPVLNFVNAKFLAENPNGITAQEWVANFAGQLVLQAIIFVIMLVLMIVGIHFAGHYIKKFRRNKKTFRKVDIIAGGVFGIVNAYVVFSLILGVLNILPPIALDPIRSMIEDSALTSFFYNNNFIGNIIAAPPVKEVASLLMTLIA